MSDGDMSVHVCGGREAQHEQDKRRQQRQQVSLLNELARLP